MVRRRVVLALTERPLAGGVVRVLAGSAAAAGVRVACSADLVISPTAVNRTGGV